MNTFEFALDLSKQTAMEPLRLRQGDRNGTEVRATIYDHGTLVTGSYTSRICLGLPDGTHYYRKAGTFSAGVATVTIDEQEAASVVGRSYGYIQLLSGSTVIASTASFPVLVLPDATADATVPESYDTAIQEAIDGLNDAVADLPDTVEEIIEQHPEWTTTVQDNSLTDSKLIQSGGILSRNARLMYRLANLLTHRTDEGTLAAISDAAKTPMAGLSVYGQSTQDGTPTPEAPVAIESVGGNLYRQTVFAAGQQRVQSGVTFTFQPDGSVVADGTLMATALAAWEDTKTTDGYFVSLPAGTYTVCGSHNVEVKRRDGSSLTTIVNYTTARYATFTLSDTSDIMAAPVITGSGSTYDSVRVWVAIYSGSVPYRYVPYGHAGLWARGFNQWDEQWEQGSIVTGTGANSTNNTRIRSRGYIPITPSREYYFKMPDNSYVYFYGSSGDYIGYYAYSVSGQAFTPALMRNALEGGGSFADAAYMRFRCDSVTTYDNDICINLSDPSHNGEYQPYTESVTPVPLDGHELRSLPDGTRDELTVDAEGHAVLVQRVGVKELVSSDAWQVRNTGTASWYYEVRYASDMNGVQTTNLLSNRYVGAQITNANTDKGIWLVAGSGGFYFRIREDAEKSLADFKTWLDSNPVTVLYPLATPVTHDLGTVPLVPLVGPDLTAQTVPTAPFVLDAERDLNVTLARLESAIAALA